MNDDGRPNPDELLEGIKKTEAKSNRGKLKIFFGMCPGVGKTFAMLRAAHEKKAAGLSVAVGVVETHQRSDTEKLLSGLTVYPRKKISYKDTALEEFDLDYALEQKPELILVDELAHTNAPGSRHPKRYQDIQDLLFAGINVYTTMNVQHVESRADLVYQISGVPVRETVPDQFLELADQIELIDLSPEDLIRRLADGKVYLGDRALHASQNFFKEEKLTALRELALRFTAEIVDDQLRDHMQSKRILHTWNTNERLMVAVSHSPSSARLIRATRRMAFNLEAPWVALYVDTRNELHPEDHETLTKNLNLARELGAEIVTTQDRSVSEALKRIAAEKNVTQIVMGRPDRRWIRDALSGGTILDQLVNQTSEVDIHVIRQQRKPIYRGVHFRLPELTSGLPVYFKTLLYVLGLSAIGYPLVELVGYRAIGFGFLLGILPVAMLTGKGPVLFSAALSSILWNYFFIPPQFTFEIGQTEDVMMITAYFAVASMAGFLVSRIKRQERDLLQREHRANILFELGRGMSDARSQDQIVAEATRSIERAYPSRVTILLAGRDQTLLAQPTVSEKDFAVATWTFEHRQKAGWKTNTLPSADCWCLPLRGRESTMGVLLLYPKERRSLTLDQENFIETICTQTAIALEREMLEGQSRQNEIYERSEKLHQALLNTVSHELRTPLTTIIGGVSQLSPSPLVEDIIQSAERLNQTIENLMDMSRLSSGALKLNEHVFEMNDLLHSVLQRARIKSHQIELELKDDNLFVKGDEKLLEHVLLNLITNAMKHSPEHSTLVIRSRRDFAHVEVSVLDAGKGIPEDQLNLIFDRFYRILGSPPGGVGLGLSISKAIVEAHGGTIRATNRPDVSGAAFTLTLPAQQVPTEVFQ